MPSSGVGKVITFSREILSERRLPTLIDHEATPVEPIDLRVPGQSEVPDAEDEGTKRTLLISSLTKQVLESPNKDMLVSTLLYHLKSWRYMSKKGNLEKHETLKIEDRVQFRGCLEYLTTSETHCICGRIIGRISAAVNNQATQRNRFPDF